MTCADSCKLTVMKNEDLLENIKNDYEQRTRHSSPVCTLNINTTDYTLTRPGQATNFLDNSISF